MQCFPAPAVAGPREIPLMNIIRVWGVLVDYKPRRQRRRSRALLRHGADGPAALAVVLGEPAEDIGVGGDNAG
jgi:hypothetical protein